MKRTGETEMARQHAQVEVHRQPGVARPERTTVTMAAHVDGDGVVSELRDARRELIEHSAVVERAVHEDHRRRGRIAPTPQAQARAIDVGENRAIRFRQVHWRRVWSIAMPDPPSARQASGTSGEGRSERSKRLRSWEPSRGYRMNREPVLADAARSIERPPVMASSSSFLMSVRTYTMRSPFLPEIFAQSSGFVVFGRSSCSLNSCAIDAMRSLVRMPGGSPEIWRLIASFFAAHDVLDHGARGEVLEEHDLLVTVLIRDLEESVLLVVGVHRLDRALDHRLHSLRGVTAAEVANFVGVERQVGREVTPEDLRGRPLVGPLDLDLHVEAARPQDRGVDEVFAVRRADDDDVLQRLDAVDLREELRHDRRTPCRS